MFDGNDISKCSGDGCDIKEYCWRFGCPGDPLYQAYVMITPNRKAFCDCFWRHSNTKKVEKAFYDALRNAIFTIEYDLAKKILFIHSEDNWSIVPSIEDLDKGLDHVIELGDI